MAQVIVMPKLGNSVDSVLLLAWHVAVGDSVRRGQPLCEVETDKAALDVECEADGVLLSRYFEAGDEVPVQGAIAVIGAAGESVADLTPDIGAPEISRDAVEPTPPLSAVVENRQEPSKCEAARPFISPRARNLAQRKGVDIGRLAGSGPGGRIIERDIRAALTRDVKLTPVAKAMLDSGDYQIAPDASQNRRIAKADLQPAERDDTERIPLAGARKTIARRMLESAQSTAQLTLHRSADARALQAFRHRLKSSEPALSLRDISINDLLLFAVARALPEYPELNATFEGDIITRHRRAQLGMAVDTPRALLVPVIRDADSRSLRQLSAEARRLTQACRDGKITPEDMLGGSFTVTNLGMFGIESFTPILNPPQVAILGIGSINLKPLHTQDSVEFAPHIALSLTLNHQVVDGAPAARFLQSLAANIGDIDLLALES